MPKTILIFSDGTGQIGGLRPDQRLSNIYKMYRAMRPGPDSPIMPHEQVAFYDPGLGAGEVGGLTFRRLRNVLAAAVGLGIDENVIDCYAAIIARYESGDRICLFGFSRGAYTVRTLANVLNLCGVPAHDAQGNPVPRHGPALRRIASEAVRSVYNHGAGKKRTQFECEREEKARRFRASYGSAGTGADGEEQGNVQPYFVGVFDTVAALGNRWVSISALAGLLILLGAAWLLAGTERWWVAAMPGLAAAAAVFWLARIWAGQFKVCLPASAAGLRWWDPRLWILAVRHGHFAAWRAKYYDRYADREIRYLRHALSIDEERAKFAHVPWGSSGDLKWNEERGRSDWLKQVWFAGNHSDIGGSYPEDESRLSDIALAWMVEELRAAMGGSIKIRDEVLFTAPDPLGLQHDERRALLDKQPGWLRKLTRDKLAWRRKVRAINVGAALHPLVLERFAALAVPQMGEVKPYRPASLVRHQQAGRFYEHGSGQDEESSDATEK